MPFVADHADRQIKSRLDDISGLINSIKIAHDESEKAVKRLNDHGKALTSGEVPTTNLREALRELYVAATVNAGNEVTTLQSALNKIYEIRTIINDQSLGANNGRPARTTYDRLMEELRSGALYLPLWVSNLPQNKIPPLCGKVPALPGYIAKTGDMVAALVNAETWILAVVGSHNPDNNQYEVYDIEDPEQVHLLCCKNVIPLPLMRANPETDAEALFDEGTAVLAVYPETTCFYPAVVREQPKICTAGYILAFEDSSFPGGYEESIEVPQRYVIPFKRD